MCRAGLQPLCRCGGGNARPPAAGRSLPRARPEDSPLPHVPESPWHAPHAREAPRPPGAASCPTPAVPVSPRGAIASPSKPEGAAGKGTRRAVSDAGRPAACEAAAQDPASRSPPPPSQRRPRAPWGDTRRGRPVSPAQTSHRGLCRVRGTGRVSKRVRTAAGTRAAQLGRRVFAGRRGRAGARGGARAGLVRAAEALCDRAGRLQGGKTKNKKQSIVQGRDCGRGGRPPILTPGNTGPGVREPHSVQADDSLLRRTTVHPKSRARLADARRRSSRGA